MSPQPASPFPFAAGSLLQKQATAGRKPPEMTAPLREHCSPNVSPVIGSHGADGRRYSEVASRTGGRAPAFRAARR